MKVVIGSRGSQLALWQANWVKDQLSTAGHEIAIEIIRTTGDKLQSYPPERPLPDTIAQSVAEAGTKGLFIKEIEEALLAGKVDLAVHSLKDLPTILPAGLILAVVPPREDARDVFISAGGKPFEQLPAGARVGTSSPRRQTQLRHLRPDLELVAMRGNLARRWFWRQRACTGLACGSTSPVTLASTRSAPPWDKARWRSKYVRVMRSWHAR
jgi:hydroxymethylbilane synthase